MGRSHPTGCSRNRPTLYCSANAQPRSSAAVLTESDAASHLQMLEELRRHLKVLRARAQEEKCSLTEQYGRRPLTLIVLSDGHHRSVTETAYSQQLAGLPPSRPHSAGSTATFR